jgi:hypothetical protein
MKVDESYDIPQYFFGQIPYFRSVSSNCDVLLAFCNFVPWWMKFFCLLSYCFASRQHWQIFWHSQTKGDISNIADTYCWGLGLKKTKSLIVLPHPQPAFPTLPQVEIILLVSWRPKLARQIQLWPCISLSPAFRMNICDKLGHCKTGFKALVKCSLG